MSRGRPTTNLTGQKFERLLVVEPAGKIGRNSASRCLCDCGNEKIVMNQNLKSGNVRSCGCLHRESASARVKANPPRLKHGASKDITYTSWQGMRSRCYDSSNNNFRRYGGRGITICRRWLDPDNGYTNFVEDMGLRPSEAHSIDRIDGSGNYEPSNCRWATRDQQNQNVGLKRSNKLGYKGISPSNTKLNPWKAEIRNSGHKIHLGCYETKEEAALAYNVASERLHGVFGQRNSLTFIGEDRTRKVFQKVNEYLKQNEKEENIS